MDIRSVNNFFGDIDMDLLDMILKGHFEDQNKILEIGCGGGRNLIHFLQTAFDLYAIDTDPSAVEMARFIYREMNIDPTGKILTEDISSTSFDDGFFDSVICSRVLHFSEDETSFKSKWNEISRILKSDGVLYCTMDSMIGFENYVTKVDSSKWKFSDGTIRFLLSEELLRKIEIERDYEYIEILKTIHYGDKHAQSILKLRKK